MKKYILKRILIMIPTLIGITFITYSLVRFSAVKYYSTPGETFSEQSAAAINSQAYKNQIKLFGLDKPAYEGYFLWVKKFASLDFGISLRDGRKVSARIIEALPRTIALNIYSFAIIYLIAIPLGIYLSVKKDTLTDHLSSIGMFLIYSVPSFWLALLLLTFLAGGEYFNIFPLEGFLSEGNESASLIVKCADIFYHLTLPAVVLSIGGIVFYTQFIKSTMIGTLNKQFIIAARGRGLSEKHVLFKHAFRNSLIPLVTMTGFLLPEMFGGSVIIESIFSIPGMGFLAFDSVLSRDITVIMAITAVSSILTLAGILLSDILYTIVDPRIRVEQ